MQGDSRWAIVVVAALVLIVVAGIVGYLGYLGYKQRQQVESTIAVAQENAEKVKWEARAARSAIENQESRTRKPTHRLISVLSQL